ncbi:MAG: type IVB secretion system protein IcmH/DotU [Colwellia sp.]|nr:type IVB secretion system protein IcmH/DotU [Colwellia sp.]
MSAASQNTTSIDFGESVMNNQTTFDYSDNDLYNLSMPLLSILLTLDRLPKPDNLPVFKSLLKQHIVDLSEQGQKLNYPTAVIDKLCCLHCIVLDEFIIHGSWGASVSWENNTLLSELFNLQSGGDLFFTITEKAMRLSGKMSDLLSVIYIFLQMGFKGRYRSRQSEKIGIVTKQLSALVTDKKITPEVVMQESPVNKPLLLVSNRRYFSITFIFIVLIILVVTFFDYWFKETYPARSRAFLEINEINANYIIDEGPLVETNKNEGLIVNELQPDLDNQQPISALYRVQLSSFSVQENAKKFALSLDSNRYELLIKQIGVYYVVYSSASSLSVAEQQKQYYKETYQTSAIVFQLDNISNSVL